LVLGKETLRELGKEQLGRVGGASGEDCISFRFCFSREICFPIVF
jgi:hypothetical protein